MPQREAGEMDGSHPDTQERLVPTHRRHTRSDDVIPKPSLTAFR